MHYNKKFLILILKSVIPKVILEKVTKYRLSKDINKYKNLSTKEIFTKIYAEGAWGKATELEQKFYSGSGSHDGYIVSSYTLALEKRLAQFETKPNVVDLGCGDFFVGAKIRNLCNEYVACDIVEPLINFNKIKYAHLNVKFKVLDITKDELPNGEIVFIRQVLQHLSNEQIIEVLHRISTKYKYIILTEHLPTVDSFMHNIDKPTGADVRLTFNSGVVLTSTPFNLKVKSDTIICEVIENFKGGGLIRTNIYELR
jgi:SAM-dependent methyltransferase